MKTIKKILLFWEIRNVSSSLNKSSSNLGYSYLEDLYAKMYDL